MKELKKKALELSLAKSALYGTVLGTVLMIGLYLATAIMLVSLGAWAWVVWLWFVSFTIGSAIRGFVNYNTLVKPKQKPVVNITIQAEPDARVTAERVANAMKRGFADSAYM